MTRSPAQPSIVTASGTASAATRRRIEEAACAIVVRDGFANLTLEAVAKAADVSKGGLLYHFPSKRALLIGMIEQRFSDFEAEVQKHLIHESGPGRWLRAIIRASCSKKPSHLQESAAIFAVLANDSELLDRVRARRAQFEERIGDDQLDPVASALVSLALDGLCFSELMGVSVLRGSRRDQVVQQLLAMATPAAKSKRSKTSSR